MYDLCVWQRDNIPSYDQIILEETSRADPHKGWCHTSSRLADPARYPKGNRMQLKTKFRGEKDAEGKAVYHTGFIYDQGQVQGAVT